MINLAVWRLADRVFNAGSHGQRWDARNETGGEAAHGIYLARIRIADNAVMRSISVVR